MDISLGVVGRLVELVSNCILGGSGTGAQVCVAVLGNILVGLLGSLRAGALDGLRNVVCGVLFRSWSACVSQKVVWDGRACSATEPAQGGWPRRR